MASVFDSCVELQVLRFFLIHPAERFYVKQLAKLLGVSAGSASVCCKSLRKKALLKAEKQGNLLLYGLERENAVTRQLGKAVVAEEFFESGALENFLMEDPNIISLAIYGSFAKSDFDKRSDLDVLVITSEKKSFAKAATLLEKKFKREVSLTTMTFEEWSTMGKKREPLFFNVLSDHILLYGGKLAIE